MSNLTLSGLCIIIPLLEKELNQLHRDMDSYDDAVSNDASELSIPYGATAAKLESIYKFLWDEDVNYPSYKELLKRG